MPAVTQLCGGGGSGGGAALATVHPLVLPELRVGTLDSLMGQSELLEKTELQCEQLTVKMGKMLHDLLMPDHEDKLNDSLGVNGSTIEAFVDSFKWDAAKFPTKQSIPQLEESIQKTIINIDKTFKARTQQYNAAKTAVLQHDRKHKGTLVNKSLTGLVKKEHCIESEYLKTFFVVVPRNAHKEWLECYETLVAFIVPKSSDLLAQDEEFSLFNVVCFKRVGEDLKAKCREKKFVVRDFEYQDGEYEQGINERSELEEHEQKQWGLLVRWTKINFGEAYSTCVHVKALRLFVESVLRFSLPPDFAMAALRPLHKKNDKKIRQLLDKRFAEGGDGNLSTEFEQMNMQVQGLASMMQGEYHPYVLIEGHNISRAAIFHG